MRRRVVIAASVAAPVLVLGLIGAARLAPQPSVPTERLERQPFARSVLAEGTLRAVKSTPITTPPDLQRPLKIAWLIADGSPVAAGDVIVRFDPSELEKELESGKLDQGSSDERIAKAQASVDATRRNLDRDAEVAESELANARAFQTKDAEIYSRFEIISSQIDADLAARKRDHAHTLKTIKARVAETDIELLAIERRKAGIMVDQAQRGLGASVITAPHGGLVVLVRDWRGDPPRVGETVWGGEKVAEIPELETLEAEVFVLEADAGGLVVGQPATVTVEGRSGEAIAGTIKRIDTIAKTRFRGSPVQYFGATIELAKDVPVGLKPGQRVQTRFALAELPNAIAVPRQAVLDRNGAKVVYRWRRWRGFEPIEVTIGPIALGRVVIEKGLSAGDEVALVDPSQGPAQAVASPSAAPALGGGR